MRKLTKTILTKTEIKDRDLFDKAESIDAWRNDNLPKIKLDPDFISLLNIEAALRKCDRFRFFRY